MKLAYIVFDGITWLDLVGVYEPVSRLKSLGYIPAMSWDFCAYTETASDYGGLKIIPTKIKNDLAEYDAIIIPGGKGTRDLIHDTDFLDWIRAASHVKHKISVCTGSLILGAAGFLKDKHATTHFDEYETLEPYCKEVLAQRIVADGDCITAGAVSSSIDLGLFLCREWAGDDAALMVRYKMDYLG